MYGDRCGRLSDYQRVDQDQSKFERDFIDWRKFEISYGPFDGMMFMMFGFTHSLE